MKSGRALIGIFQKIRIKKLRGVSEVRLKKLDSFTLKTSKNQLIRNFLRNGRLRVKYLFCYPKYTKNRAIIKFKIRPDDGSGF